MFDSGVVGAPSGSGRAGAASWQPSLLDLAAPTVAVDHTFSGLTRIGLDDESWVDHQRGWLSGSDVVFEDLLTTAAWRSREVEMYHRRLPEPRLTARWPGPLPDALEGIRTSLAERYGIPFDGVAVNLYRDGNDSVAWHGDRVGAVLRHPVVATVSLGAARLFRLRPRSGGPGRGLLLGPGDLLVMGGAIQHGWEHCVPKTRRPVGPRMAITVRHSHELAGERPAQENRPRSGEPPSFNKTALVQ